MSGGGENNESAAPEKLNGNWIVNDWIKKAVILYFPLMKMKTIEVGPFEFHDKISCINNLSHSFMSFI